MEARYRRDRLAIYKQRVYAGRPSDPVKLRELQRSFDGAMARLRRAQGKTSA